ncbi:O-antigen ligase family protein [Stakelama sp. CBK3Z-3]|uniref:O-antigen ligase family protein n=1 Tax=Stakelama flava TaxID=2860338 RepID=A0ABS6XK23_9SPHN|nr:O-antigen ligase family protein [Stakelama flava]MBW4330274.1 O-antigen ligase family protein [Stakelama flava]
MIATYLFLLLCLLGGGASRVTDEPLIAIRPFAVLLLALVIALAPARIFAPYRAPLLILGLLALTMIMQLVPLPPGLWQQLPLSADFNVTLKAVGLDELWRPISIAPDLTLNSLFALLPPIATLSAAAAMPPHVRRDLMTWLLIGMAFSAVLGLAQFAGGANSPLYFWEARSAGVADGVFANRNHHALFLTVGLALLGPWITNSSPHRRNPNVQTRRLAAGGGLAILFLAAVVTTGSRTGSLLAAVATVFSYVVVLRSNVVKEMRLRLPSPLDWIIRWAWVITPLLVIAMIIAGRALSFDRLTSLSVTGDQRYRSLPVMIDMVQQLLPFGSGYGTFDTVFRIFEPDSLLHYGYFNHAHNDFLELLIVGGLPAALILVLGIAWWMRATLRVLLVRNHNWDRTLGRAAALSLLLIALGSLVDYPVRTPLIACLIAILVVWLVDGQRGSAMPRGTARESAFKA